MSTDASDAPGEEPLAPPGDVSRALERHLPGLHAFVRMNLGPFLAGQEAVSDVVQSAAREVLLRAGSFEWRGEAAFRSYLCTVATRKILEKRRRYVSQRRDARRNEPAGGASSPNLPSGAGLTPSEALAEVEGLDRLQQALDELDEEDRLVLSMATTLELTPSQIAAELQIPLRTAQWRLARARARLAGKLRRGGDA